MDERSPGQDIPAAPAQRDPTYRALLESLPVPLVILSIGERVREVNRAFALAFGHTPETLPALDDWLESPPSAETSRRDQVSRASGYVAAARRGESVLPREYKVRCRDGSTKVVEVSVGTVGEHVLVACADRTEPKRLEAELAWTQRMDAVGRLAGGIAHNINNVITVIQGFAEELLRSLAPADPRREDVSEILKAAERAASLTRQLLAFGRRSVIAPTVTDLNTIVRDAETSLSTLLSGKGIRLGVRLARTPWPVKVDVSQLHQALTNLIVNARDTMPGGGTVEIETTNVVIEAESTGERYRMPPGPYVVLSVADDGEGMTDDVRQRAFEPFATPRKSGLGLATVYGVVKRAGGFISVTSEPGHGTTFRLYLPRAQEPAPTPGSQPAATVAEPAATLAGRVVLLVEDEEPLRRMTRRTLERDGCEVVEAGTGAEALSLAGQPGPRFDLVVTDVVMPGMNGRQLVDALQRLHPDLPALFMSGYTQDAIAASGVLEEGTALLHKPFLAKDLLERVRAMLSRRRPGGAGEADLP